MSLLAGYGLKNASAMIRQRVPWCGLWEFTVCCGGSSALSRFLPNAGLMSATVFATLAQHYTDGVMHNWSNPFFGMLSNQALKVLTFLVNQAADNNFENNTFESLTWNLHWMYIEIILKKISKYGLCETKAP